MKIKTDFSLRFGKQKSKTQKNIYIVLLNLSTRKTNMRMKKKGKLLFPVQVKFYTMEHTLRKKLYLQRSIQFGFRFLYLLFQ